MRITRCVFSMLVSAYGACVSAFAESGTSQPRLALVISIDQFRGDYLERFGPHFTEGGFKRLLAGGTHFQQCYYRHAVTKTAPGHATILSGSHADVHGIIGNEWLDRTTGRMVESVEDADFPIVGSASTVARSPGGIVEAKAGRSPRRFQATTVGDQLKLRFGTRSKIFAVSNKDRSAILMAGKLADSAYWMERGRLVTSTYYRRELPAWVAAFNVQQRVESSFGQVWERLLAPAVYDAIQGADDAAGESVDFGLGRTFPHKLDGGRAELSADFFNAFDNSPLSTALVGEFAALALREEKLGQHDATDLLCVGFSQIDTVGHSYGPDSHELMDSVLRLDRVIASLLETIDQQIGLERCVIVLTADHGASPLPERVHAIRPDIPAGRFKGDALDALVTQALDKTYGSLTDGNRWVIRDNFGYHFTPSILSEKKISADDAALVVKNALLNSPQIAQAFTRSDILAMPSQGDSNEAMTRRSYYPSLSQDVVFVLKPYFVDRKSGTNHGTPYLYDRHVPLLFFGAGVPHSSRSENVGVDDLAPTLSALLRLPPPPQATGRQLLPTRPLF